MASIRFRKFLLLGLLMAVPIIAHGRRVIFFLDSQEVKEEGQGEDGASLEQALVPEDSDEWDEFQDTEDGTDDEFNPGSWRRVLEERRGRENVSEAEHWYVSGVSKMMKAVTEDQPKLINEAMADLQQAVDSGHPHAQSTLGFLYGIGSGVEQSDAKAFLYHYFGAQGGDYQSKMAVAYSFYRQQMLDKAVDLYADLASVAVASFFSSKETPLVDPIRIYDGTEENKEGLKKSRGEDDDDFQIIEYQAHKGNALAMNKLGLFYYLGLRGVPRDHAKALSWFLKAVEKGEYESMELIGEIYARGFGVQRNYTKALNWFKDALKQKHVSAYNGIGYLYAKGYGVDGKNFTRAREYFKRAADAGDPNGHYNLGVLYLKGLGVSKDVKSALTHFTEAANSGHPKALYQLAKMFHKGVGLKKDLSNAVNLYKIVAERGPWGSMLRWALECYLKGQTAQALLLYSRAAELGYEIAQSNAAWILEKYGGYDICIGKSGYCSDVECHQRAHTLWWRASEQGNEQATLLIGDAYYYGRGTDKDFERAAGAYMHAHSQANAQAMFNLGYMYEHGEGLPYDLHLAKRYYDQALETDPAAKLPVKLALLSVWIRMNYAETFLVNALDSLPELVPRLGDWLKKTLLDEGNITLVTLFVCLLTVLYLRERQRRIAVQGVPEDEAENN